MGPVKHKKLLNSRSRLLPVQMGWLHSISTWQLIPPDFSHSCSVFPVCTSPDKILVLLNRFHDEQFAYNWGTGTNALARGPTLYNRMPWISRLRKTTYHKAKAGYLSSITNDASIGHSQPQDHATVLFLRQSRPFHVSFISKCSVW